MGRSEFYFAYGSNMNANRMRERGLRVEEAVAGTLVHYKLVFNKKASNKPGFACANIAVQHNDSVQGVVYRLRDHREIEKMDRFEGVPCAYSRDIFSIQTVGGSVPAWTYVANPAVLVTDMLPSHGYIQHLLQGCDYLSDDYLAWIANHPAQ